VLGLDESIASLSDESSTGVVLLVAALLGLRHATDPDHLAAVAVLVAGDREAPRGTARRLGFAWGLGHAVSLVVLGTPIVVFSSALPAAVSHAAEIAVGGIVMLLSVRVLVRWPRGYWHVHAHAHEDGRPHVHLHAHEARDARHTHSHRAQLVRSPAAAFAVGLVHGVGGTAAVGVLLLAAIDAQIGRAHV
jgi:high-affinity nickel permease